MRQNGKPAGRGNQQKNQPKNRTRQHAQAGSFDDAKQHQTPVNSADKTVQIGRIIEHDKSNLTLIGGETGESATIAAN